MAEAASGGRTWWAHFEFTRINIEPIILKKRSRICASLTVLCHREPRSSRCSRLRRRAVGEEEHQQSQVEAQRRP